MAGFVFVSFMMVALFAARFASYVTPSRATTVLLKLPCLGLSHQSDPAMRWLSQSHFSLQPQQLPAFAPNQESSIRRSLLSQRHENHRLFSFGPRKRLSSTRGERVGREQMRLYWNRST